VARLLRLVPLGLADRAIVVAVSAIPAIVGQAIKLARGS